MQLRSWSSLLFVVPLVYQCGALQPKNHPSRKAREPGLGLRQLGGSPCEENPAFSCFNIDVPLDHSNPAGKQISLAYAAHYAPKEKREGILLHINGGPGYSGIASLSDLSDVDAHLAERYDIVYFDLRGVKRSGNIDCPRAAAKYYEGGLRAASPDEEIRLTQKAKTFAEECISETGRSSDELQYYNTDAAARDIEFFRNFIGEEKLSLYGLSYGTQLAQTYAHLFPDHVSKMVLDGTVDLTLSHTGYMLSLARAITAILDTTVESCAELDSCRQVFASAPGKAWTEKIYAAYDHIASQLDGAPRIISYPLSTGGTSRRIFSRNDFDTMTFNAMYAASTRAEFMEALGKAYTQDDFVTLQTAAYHAADMNPDTATETGSAEADPGMSNAIYYIVTCNDYGSGAPTEEESLRIYFDQGHTLWKENTRVLAPYYGDIPCAVWPHLSVIPTQPIMDQKGIPTMVVDSSTDAATPFEQGVAVGSRLDDGSIIKVIGGEHIMFGKNACVNSAVSSFVLEGKHPDGRTLQCQDRVL